MSSAPLSSPVRAPRSASDRRTAAHAVASAVTILLLGASVTGAHDLDRFLWSVPHILANVSQLVLLTLATVRKPGDIDQSGRAFVYGVLGTVAPVTIAWFGSWMPFGETHHAVALAGRYLNLVPMPFYLVAIWTLGRNVTVLPEATTLKTRGVYSFSRHPLYATYLYWYTVQNLIFQSWGAVLLSSVQIVLTVARARLEERILERNFAEYGSYSARVSWFGPKRWWPRSFAQPRTPRVRRASPGGATR